MEIGLEICCLPRMRGAWPPLGYKGQEYGFGIVGYSGRIFGLATAMPCPRLRSDGGVFNAL